MRWILCLAAILAIAGATPARAAATSARLILPVEQVQPGETFHAGVELTMDEGWHTYWRNGGDSGAPTKIRWNLPPGLTAGEIQWPAPEKYVQGDLITYVYHGTVTLLVPLAVASDAPHGSVEIHADVNWLECEALCVPGSAKVSGRLVISDTTVPSTDAERIARAQSRIPPPLAEPGASAAWAGPPEGKERPLVIQWRKPDVGGRPDFYPYSGKDFEVSTATEAPSLSGDTIALRKKVKLFGDTWPESVSGLLVITDPRHAPLFAAAVTLPIADKPDAAPVAASPAFTAASDGAPAGGSVGAPAPADPKTTLGLLGAMGFGFLGGIILNIMPCVLPVIALKVLGFVRQAGSEPRRVRQLGIIYGLGVWFSFLLLAGVVIAVKQAVGVASWGMQFGNPVFLIAMTTLVLLVALSLFGVFEFNLTGRAMDTAGELASREGSAGAFFHGMLAVALATPCTAPFLAPALGYAFVASPLTIVLVFSAIAAGLAAPYILLSWHPAWLRFVPKPGRWMERFKIAMGFPMLATALWLYTLTATRFGRTGPLWVGIFLVGVAAAAWIWGEFVQRGQKRQRFSMGLAFATVLLFYFVALENRLDWRRATRAEKPAMAAGENRTDRIQWQPWSPDAVEAARREGRPVLVDFTADWCLTCLANEVNALDVPPVRAKLNEIGAVPLKGDYTDVPPEITRELQRFNRAGVPLVLVYPKDPSREPIVLPEVLTRNRVLEALDEAVM